VCSGGEVIFFFLVLGSFMFAPDLPALRAALHLANFAARKRKKHSGVD
jgi:hypothetical protein